MSRGQNEFLEDEFKRTLDQFKRHAHFGLAVEIHTANGIITKILVSLPGDCNKPKMAAISPSTSIVATQ